MQNKEKNDNIASEIDKVIDKMSSEAIAATEKEATGAQVPAGEDVAEKAAEAPQGAEAGFVADDALIERAVKAGLTIADAKGFISAEMAERILAKLELKDTAKTEKEDVEGKEVGGDDEDSVTKEFAETLQKMEEDGDYSPEFVKMFKGVGTILKRQAEEIRKLSAAGDTAANASFFDRQFSGLGEDVVKHIDAASKSKLEAKFKMLEAGYKATEAEVKREDIFKEAAHLAIGDILAKAEAESKAAKLEERRRLAIARPGGETGARREKSGDDAIAEVVAEVAREFSLQ